MAEEEIRRSDPGPLVTPELFHEWRTQRFGTANPERLTNPVWEWLVRTELSAFAASRHFGLASGECREPGWSFERFGRTTTTLGDGRCIHIAGEHEDAYDRDFCIYNDVVVRHVDGSLDIFGYPRETFPPTDFHSATVAGDDLVLVGNLGYPHERLEGTTQVVLLDLSTFAMTPMQARGDGPGWIHRHSAALTDDRRAIVISRGLVQADAGPHAALRENGDEWQLDLASWEWQRLTNRNWRQWQLTRADRGVNHVSRLRSLSRFRDVHWATEHRKSMEEMMQRETDALRAAYGADLAFDVCAELYVPAVSHQIRPLTDEEPGAHRIRVEGTVVRYVESPWSVRVVIEGELPEGVAAALVADVRDKLSIIERTDYEAREL